MDYFFSAFSPGFFSAATYIGLLLQRSMEPGDGPPRVMKLVLTVCSAWQRYAGLPGLEKTDFLARAKSEYHCP